MQTLNARTRWAARIAIETTSLKMCSFTTWYRRSLSFSGDLKFLNSDSIPSVGTRIVRWVLIERM